MPTPNPEKQRQAAIKLFMTMPIREATILLEQLTHLIEARASLEGARDALKPNGEAPEGSTVRIT